MHNFSAIPLRSRQTLVGEFMFYFSLLQKPKKPLRVQRSMATATFRSILRRNISSATFNYFSGAKNLGTVSYLSRKLGVIVRPFSSRHFGIEVIGIDLGTTNSRVAVMEGETAKVIRNAEGSLSTPSVVAFDHKGELIVGTSAKHQAINKPRNTVFGAKRWIGRRFDDSQTQKEKRKVPYNIVKALNGDACVEANGQKYSPSDIGAFVLAKMKETAEDYLGSTVNEAIISVPCYFTDAQRQATEDAARIAGLNVLRIINEPTAAAISYALNNRDGLIAVFDLGGGTFDVSIVKIVNSVDYFECEVRAQNGDASLGGEDFDDAIVDILISEFKRTNGVYLTHVVALQRLREAAEKAKIELSTEAQTNIDLPFITYTAYGAEHLNITLTRLKFEAQVNHLIERIKSPCKACMEDARITTNELDEVILVGGMSHVPIVQEVVTEIFGKTPIKMVNPDEAVAMGASYYGWLFLSWESEETYLEATHRKGLGCV